MNMSLLSHDFVNQDLDLNPYIQMTKFIIILTICITMKYEQLPFLMEKCSTSKKKICTRQFIQTFFILFSTNLTDNSKCEVVIQNNLDLGSKIQSWNWIFKRV